MTTEEQVKYWTGLADYDLVTAKVMLKGKRYLYVGCMCHQAVEKILKAYYVKKRGEQPPFFDQLTRLAELAGLYDMLPDKEKDLVDILDPLSTVVRYPTYKEDLFKLLTAEKSKTIIERTVDLFKWIKERL